MSWSALAASGTRAERLPLQVRTATEIARNVLDPQVEVVHRPAAHRAPVEPKPPAPRGGLSSSDTCTSVIGGLGVMTNWHTRSPCRCPRPRPRLHHEAHLARGKILVDNADGGRDQIATEGDARPQVDRPVVPGRDRDAEPERIFFTVPYGNTHAWPRA